MTDHAQTIRASISECIKTLVEMNSADLPRASRQLELAAEMLRALPLEIQANLVPDIYRCACLAKRAHEFWEGRVSCFSFEYPGYDAAGQARETFRESQGFRA